MTATPTHYVAIDRWETAIYGIGATPEAALAEALDPAYGNCADAPDFYTRPCTPALAAKVEHEGGAISWSELADGTQCTLDEQEG